MWSLSSILQGSFSKQRGAKAQARSGRSRDVAAGGDGTVAWVLVERFYYRRAFVRGTEHCLAIPCF